jgi:hypothetical protein
MDVDGFMVRFHKPTLRPGSNGWSAEQVRSFRTAYYYHAVVTSAHLAQFANRFQRDWLAQIYLSALSTEAITRGCSLHEAQQILEVGDTGARLAEVLGVIFQTLAVEDPDQAHVENARLHTDRRGARHRELESLCRTNDVLVILADLAEILWQEADADWEQWAVERFKSTLGAAVVEACQQLCPEIDASGTRGRI